MNTHEASRKYLAARQMLKTAAQFGCDGCISATHKVLEGYKETSMKALRACEGGAITEVAFVRLLLTMAAELEQAAKDIGVRHSVDFLFMSPDDPQINVGQVGLA